MIGVPYFLGRNFYCASQTKSLRFDCYNLDCISDLLDIETMHDSAASTCKYEKSLQFMKKKAT